MPGLNAVSAGASSVWACQSKKKLASTPDSYGCKTSLRRLAAAMNALLQADEFAGLNRRIIALNALFFDVVDVEPVVNDFIGWNIFGDVAFEEELQVERHFADALVA